MRWWTRFLDRAERNVWWREGLNAVYDGAYWGWLISLVAAVAVWVARGIPDPRSAVAAAALMPVGAALAGWRTWRRAEAAGPVERRAAATITARRWLTAYGVAAALIPAAYLAADNLLAGVLVTVVVVVALVELAIVTIPVRARARLLARLRIGARAVAGEDSVQVGRALWRRMRLQRVMVTYPAGWGGVHRTTKRDDLVERVMWELVGPPPTTPDEAIARPDYTTEFDHVDCRLVVTRVPGLPRRLPARQWGQGEPVMVLGQTIADAADAMVQGVPVAAHRPRNHALITGGTQFGKSSGVRAWIVDGLTHGVFPGGVWSVDGKGSGSMAALIGRHGVHAVAHHPDEWREVINEVAAIVARRYAEMLDWRAGRSTTRPHHPLALLSLDEIQQILMSCPDLAPVLDTLARQALEANVILWVITQRPDAKDAVPGAMRDQLLDRVTFGPLSSVGAKMVFDIAGDWHRALGVAPIPGRALVWMDGTWRTLQAPWLPIPADVPQVEPLYPPRTAERAPDPASEPGPADTEPSPQHAPQDPAQPRADDPAEAPEAPPEVPHPAAAYGPPPPPHPHSGWDGRPSAPWPPRPPQPSEPEQTTRDQDDDPEYNPRTARRRRRRPPPT